MSSKFKKIIEKHTLNFGWLGYGVEGPGWGEEYYIELLASLIKQKANPDDLIKKSKQEKKEVEKRQEQIIKALKIDIKHRKLFKVAQGFVFTKGYRKDTIFHGFWCLTPIHKEMAKRCNLTLKQIRQVCPWEHKKVIKAKEKWSEELSKRWEFQLYFSEKGQNKGLSKRQATEFLRGFNFEKEKKAKGVRKLEGTCASPGRVRGIIVLINSPSENKKMKQGGILVSKMTDPYLMPAIRKSRAIITDMGGLTCHAAIVSRELGIPCVIGTKIATEVLKDGTLVEVDATHGIIKLL